jgi:hypothetical protein
VGRSEGKRPLGRSRRRWKDDIKMDLREIGLGRMDWIDLTRERDQWRASVNKIINPGVPQTFVKLLSSCITGGSSRRAQLHEVIMLNILRTRYFSIRSRHVTFF